MPEDWGLYYYINGKFKEIKYPSNNFENWDRPDRDWQGEMIMLINYILCNKYFNQQKYCFNKRYKKYERLLKE